MQVFVARILGWVFTICCFTVYLLLWICLLLRLVVVLGGCLWHCGLIVAGLRVWFVACYLRFVGAAVCYLTGCLC